MKHESVAIKGVDLETRWNNDNCTAADVLGQSIELDKWYLCSWPEHVTSPDYNGDCAIQGPFDSTSECEVAAIYGE